MSEEAMIGACDCCDRQNVPVTHIDTVGGVEAFACYLCLHESEPDPYGELPKPCTCHPADNPPKPCAQKYAFSECVTHAAMMAEKDTGK